MARNHDEDDARDRARGKNSPDVTDNASADQLRAFIERIERMEEEKAAIAQDIKEIYAEAKGNGFDTKILRKIVSIRKMDANERMEQEAVLEMYMSALGMIDNGI